MKGRKRKRKWLSRGIMSAALLLLSLPAMGLNWFAEGAESGDGGSPVTVAIDSTWIPYTYLDSATGESSGTLIELMDLIAAKSGLEVQYITLNSFSEALQKVKSGTVDLILGVPWNEEAAGNSNLILTDPFITVRYCAVSKTANTTLDEMNDAIIGVCANSSGEYALRQMVGEDQIVEYAAQEDCMEAVRNGEVGYAVVTADSVSYYMEDPKYEMLHSVLVDTLSSAICIGINDQSGAALLEQLNQGIAAMTESELEHAVHGSLLESGQNRSSVFSFVSRYRIHMGLAVCVMISAIIVTASYFLTKLRGEREEVNRLRQELVQAEGAVRDKTDFLSRVSHDIRTPMNALIGMTGLALEKGNSPEVTEDYLKKIQSSSDYLLNLVNDVLDISKMDSGKMQLHPETVKLKQYFRSVEALIRPIAEKSRVELVYEIYGMDEAYAKLDKLRLQQILTNLLSNAIKFTPTRGRVDCIISNVGKEEGIRRDRIVVRDTGIGMSEEFLQKLFLPFEQEHAITPADHAGTGLGLTITKNLVSLMDGTITVTSKKGEGTEFTVEVPSEIVEESGVDERERDKCLAYDFTGRRVLLCEDHPINAEIVMKLLERKNMDVDHAENGKIGLALFSAAAEWYYDAILMDIRMPIMDGIATTKEIRALQRCDAKTLPIIAMTANAFDEDIYQCKLVGMAAHISKPVEPRVLYGTLFQFLLSVEEKSGETEQQATSAW